MTVYDLGSPSAQPRTAGSRRGTQASSLPPAPPVSDSALSAAGDLATRVKGRSAQVRRSLLVRADDSRVTSLMLLLRGREDRTVGRGGDLRLKLLLSLLWVAGAEPYDVSYPARAWATLLDLREPEKAGARRVSQALQWLDDHKFARVEQLIGRPPRVTLLRETGFGEPYLPPGAVNNRLTQQLQNATGLEEKALREQREGERYLQLQPALWTQGWIQTLSGPGLSMLLVLLAEAAGGTDRDLWLTPDLARRRYGLSPATRSSGLRELYDLKAVTMKRRTISRDVFDYRRMRNVYRINWPALTDQPTRAQVRPDDPLQG